jgi:hypothetical protein
MSRGIGKTQRAILDAMEKHDWSKTRWLSTREVAALIYYGTPWYSCVTTRQRELTRRSLMKLAALGLIYPAEARWKGKWHHWTTSRGNALHYWRRAYTKTCDGRTDDEVFADILETNKEAFAGPAWTIEERIACYTR